MATTAPAARKRASPVQGPQAVGAKAAARARPKAQWAFDGGGHGPALQAKMEVSQPEDLLEREADRVAAHVVETHATPAAPPGKGARADEMGSTVHRKGAFGVDRDDDDHPGARAQRMCADCSDGKREDEPKKVHRHAGGETAGH